MKEAGRMLIHQIGTPEAAGADVLIAQGIEAGANALFRFAACMAGEVGPAYSDPLGVDPE